MKRHHVLKRRAVGELGTTGCDPAGADELELFQHPMNCHRRGSRPDGEGGYEAPGHADVEPPGCRAVHQAALIVLDEKVDRGEVAPALGRDGDDGLAIAPAARRLRPESRVNVVVVRRHPGRLVLHRRPVAPVHRVRPGAVDRHEVRLVVEDGVQPDELLLTNTNIR